MSTENENFQQDLKLLSLVPNHLTSLQSLEGNFFKNLYEFFLKAYQNLSYLPDFNEESVREEWTENLNQLELLSIAFQESSPEEIQTAINSTIMILNDHIAKFRKEAENG